MLHRLKSLSLALAAPLILWGCVLTPGKFVSTLDIGADRSFAFTYVGEVYAVDMGKAMKDAAGDDDADKKSEPAEPSEDSEAKNRALAEALAQEAGYRKVEYAGNGRFLIDYAASGRLTHPFLFPFSSDAEVIFPFVMIELRGADRVRVKAPAFGTDTSKKGMGDAAGAGADKLDGTFTLTTDAEIVSQNNENGAAAGAGGKKTIRWRATPATKDAPMAVLKVAALGV